MYCDLLPVQSQQNNKLICVITLKITAALLRNLTANPIQPITVQEKKSISVLVVNRNLKESQMMQLEI